MANADIAAVDAQGSTPLHIACEHGKLEVDKYLVAIAQDLGSASGLFWMCRYPKGQSQTNFGLYVRVMGLNTIFSPFDGHKPRYKGAVILDASDSQSSMDINRGIKAQ
jgi:ankyrin repeat protein